MFELESHISTRSRSRTKKAARQHTSGPRLQISFRSPSQHRARAWPQVPSRPPAWTLSIAAPDEAFWSLLRSQLIFTFIEKLIFISCCPPSLTHHLTVSDEASPWSPRPSKERVVEGLCVCVFFCYYSLWSFPLIQDEASLETTLSILLYIYWYR